MSVFCTEYLQLRNSSLILYNQIEYDSNSSNRKNKTTLTKQFKNNLYSGQVKIGTQKRIRKALDLFLQSTEDQIIFNPISQRNINFRLAFITLTISNKEIQDHQFCYKNLLKPFLDWLTKTKKVNSYIWKAELQKRGQIHYHITISNFIHHSEIRGKWNYLQTKNGLIAKGTTPPSTEIKQVKNINNIEAYLAKYISKVERDNKGLNCKVWDCSTNLKKNKFFKIEYNEENIKKLIHDGIQDVVIDEIKLDNCIIIKSKEGYIRQLLKDNLKDEYERFISAIKKGEVYTPAPPPNFIERKKTKAILELERIEKMFEEVRKKSAVKKSTNELFCVDKM